MQTKEEIYKGLFDSIVAGDEAKSKEWSEKAIEVGLDPAEVILEAIPKPMEYLSKKFDDGEVFLPELLTAAESMKVALAPLREELIKGKKELPKKGTVVIGTVEGDIHEIGKTLVAVILEGSGFEVHDLGRDVPIMKYVDEAKAKGANIVGVSALMSTTTPGQKLVVDACKEEGIYDKVRVLVGGPCASEEWAKSIGAHYSENAFTAVGKALDLMKTFE